MVLRRPGLAPTAAAAHRPRLGAVAAAALAATSCAGERSVLSPAGPGARALAELGWPILVGFSLTVVVMWALLAWVALRRTGSLDEHAPVDAGGGQRWIVIGGFVVPALAFAAVFVATLRTLDAFPSHASASPPAKVAVIGHQWWWEVRYRVGPLPEWVTTANEIHIPVGEAVDVELRTADVIHSLWVPRLQGKVDLIPGQVNHVRLEADAPGVYPGACAELCGVQHAHMRLRVIAEPPERFAAWLAHQREPAAVPESLEARRGRELFTQQACALCHTIRGTGALGTVGPDLTHLASRDTLAAGSFANDPATLHAWVTNAPSLKPGVRMPALPVFRGPELRALVAYLRQLE
jgi:cytochrome c oxidase subunit 2